MHRRMLLIAAGAALANALVTAQAQDRWPSKPITYVVPFGRAAPPTCWRAWSR